MKRDQALGAIKRLVEARFRARAIWTRRRPGWGVLLFDGDVEVYAHLPTKANHCRAFAHLFQRANAPRMQEKRPRA
jgi:hypothetical protein